MAETDPKGPTGVTGEPTPARRGPGRPPGRRAGTGETRTTILDAARTEFAARGYAGASVRAIARGAGVDPALVHHYFGSKSRVFIAAMELPIDPDVVVDHVFAEGPEHVGARLAATFLDLWEDPAARERLLAMLRTAVLGDDNSATREFVTVELTTRLADRIGTEDAPLRANLAVSQLLGVALTRYILRLEPIASTPRAEIEARIAPVLQHHLDGGPRVA
ncbi:TetR family transcriptional regulator [Streptomyces sp. SID3343]|uniref:TetR/AcrR family transcriptional regulator n=1 Tax=Streptomyces sp. SID3343 TaxID=2690260 RepID=UPI0013700324|nr:TetR family transcriptional regulator [Streptomyces sp. SID3343]MYV99486.1 TetR family transcriptional regulator [Streptomyces sp. SID3343]